MFSQMTRAPMRMVVPIMATGNNLSRLLLHMEAEPSLLGQERRVQRHHPLLPRGQRNLPHHQFPQSDLSLPRIMLAMKDWYWFAWKDSFIWQVWRPWVHG